MKKQVRNMAKNLATLVSSGKFSLIPAKLIPDLAADIKRTFNRFGPEN